MVREKVREKKCEGERDRAAEVASALVTGFFFPDTNMLVWLPGCVV
jgi:hypothetical protein